MYKVLVEGRIIRDACIMESPSNGQKYLFWVIKHCTVLGSGDNRRSRFEPVVCSYYDTEENMQKRMKVLKSGNVILVDGNGRPPYEYKRMDREGKTTVEPQNSVFVKDFQLMRMGTPNSNPSPNPAPQVESIDVEDSEKAPPF